PYHNHNYHHTPIAPLSLHDALPIYRPLIARLSASVPPAVHTTSLGRAPSAAASCSRASSSARCAALPGPCREEALPVSPSAATRSEEHTSELQSRENLVCRLLLEKK